MSKSSGIYDSVCISGNYHKVSGTQEQEFSWIPGSRKENPELALLCIRFHNGNELQNN